MFYYTIKLLLQKLLRQASTDSVDSLQSGDEGSTKKNKNDNGPKRSGWLRHSFSKAFSKNGSKQKGSTRSSGSLSDVEGYEGKKSTMPDPHVRSTSAASGSVQVSR